MLADCQVRLKGKAGFGVVVGPDVAAIATLCGTRKPHVMLKRSEVAHEPGLHWLPWHGNRQQSVACYGFGGNECLTLARYASWCIYVCTLQAFRPFRTKPRLARPVSVLWAVSSPLRKAVSCGTARQVSALVTRPADHKHSLLTYMYPSHRCAPC